MTSRRIRFRASPAKSLEVILWLANQRPGIDFHAILKLLFFADVSHLNQFGRPIVGDDYKALPYGPVAQTTYDILKRDPLAMQELGLSEDDMPFTVQGRYRVHARRPADLRKLSDSDVEALHSAYNAYGHLDFNTRTDRSHDHPAYANAESAGRMTMLYEDFLEGEMATPEAVEDLKEMSARLHF